MVNVFEWERPRRSILVLLFPFRETVLREMNELGVKWRLRCAWGSACELELGCHLPVAQEMRDATFKANSLRRFLKQLV